MRISRIEGASDKQKWLYFWAKTVEDVDLSCHCAKSIVGKYLPEVKAQQLEDKIYYICGVCRGYNYAGNFHLAFEPCKGSKVNVNRCGISITIEDAVEIPIEKLESGEANHPKSKLKAFYTCRNWQFAWSVKERFGIIVHDDEKTENIEVIQETFI